MKLNAINFSFKLQSFYILDSIRIIIVAMACIMLDDMISEAELSKNREIFEQKKMPTENDKFQFALCLIRAKNKNTIAEGLSEFQTLFTSTKDEDIKRDALYYMAIGKIY